MARSGVRDSRSSSRIDPLCDSSEATGGESSEFDKGKAKSKKWNRRYSRRLRYHPHRARSHSNRESQQNPRRIRQSQISEQVEMADLSLRRIRPSQANGSNDPPQAHYSPEIGPVLLARRRSSSSDVQIPLPHSDATTRFPHRRRRRIFPFLRHRSATFSRRLPPLSKSTFDSVVADYRQTERPKTTARVVLAESSGQEAEEEAATIGAETHRGRVSDGGSTFCCARGSVFGMAVRTSLGESC